MCKNPIKVEENCIYIDNVPQHIHNICNKIILIKDFDLFSYSSFLAIKAYFRNNLEKVSNKYKSKIQTAFFVFYVPTSWTDILDTLKPVMIALLEKAGSVVPAGFPGGITFITELEAIIINKQLDPYGGNIPRYFKPENHCVLYNISADYNSAIMSPIYFQFKEDRSLKLFHGDLYLTPKVSKLYGSRQFTIPSHISTLKQLLLRNILKLEVPIANNIALPKSYSEFGNADELLVFQILSLAEVYKFT